MSVYPKKIMSLLLLLLCAWGAGAQIRNEQPQAAPMKKADWQQLRLFGRPDNYISKNDALRVDSIAIHLNIFHSWGKGNEQYHICYRLDTNYFESVQSAYQNFGWVYPPEQRGANAKKIDTLFESSFQRRALVNWLQAIARPKHVWNEQDFGYTKSKFRLNLSQLPYNRLSSERTCDDCSGYLLEMRFFTDRKQILQLELQFDSGFRYRLPKITDTALYEFKIRAMLEWMYLYQFSKLVFPPDIALNKWFFTEKEIEGFAVWTVRKFPKLNK